MQTSHQKWWTPEIKLGNTVEDETYFKVNSSTYLRQDTCELICFKFGMILDTTKLYSIVTVCCCCSSFATPAKFLELNCFGEV